MKDKESDCLRQSGCCVGKQAKAGGVGMLIQSMVQAKREGRWDQGGSDKPVNSVCLEGGVDWTY